MMPDRVPQDPCAPASDRPTASVEPRYPCWCDGADGCDNLAREPFGLCATCQMYRHGRMPEMGLTAADMEEMAQQSATDEVAQRSDAGASEPVTERVRQALAAIYSGAGPVEAENLLDQLEDRGLTVVDR